MHKYIDLESNFIIVMKLFPSTITSETFKFVNKNAFACPKVAQSSKSQIFPT